MTTVSAPGGNMASYFLDARIEEGRADAPALVVDGSTHSYGDVRDLANRYGRILREAGVRPEERVLLALPDGVEMVAAIFGTLKIGAVVVMVNPDLGAESLAYFLQYTRARAVVTARATLPDLVEASADSSHLLATLVADSAEFRAAVAAAPADLETFPSHPDDAAVWLFSGGTTGKPKAVVQSHNSFVNTTELYAKGALGYRETDRTLSVPKLFFGYATGSNLLFPFAVGASAVLFPERTTPERLFDAIERHRPTILINVPTMIGKLLAAPGAADRDLSSLRFSTSAGEALPEELYNRWVATYDSEILDGLGTAEMWHVFLTNHPGAVRPGTLGTAVEGFEVRVRDEEGRDAAPGEVGLLWVRGDSRAHGYWQRPEKTRQAFRGEWFVSGDMVRQDADGYFVYCGRGDDMLKVSGKWLAPKELENCLVSHPAVAEVAVVGVADAEGLAKPCAFVVAAGAAPEDFEAELQAWARDRLEPYKYPRTVVLMEDLPRTHLGKIDRGKLRADFEAAG